jgi:hypothetical protein
LAILPIRHGAHARRGLDQLPTAGGAFLEVALLVFRGVRVVVVVEVLMCCYYYNMSRKPLIETNPYLRVPEQYRKALITNVSSSTAVETGAPIESIVRTLTDGEKTKRVKKPKESAR